MTNKQGRQEIETFKKFVQQYPGMIREVRNGGKKWQDFYEQWVLLGEDDPSWDKYKQVDGTVSETNPSSGKKQGQGWMKQMTELMEKVDMEKVEGHIGQLNGAITNIQSLISQFQDMKKQAPSTNKPVNNNRPPFHFYGD